MFLKLIPWGSLKLIVIILLVVSTATSITGLYVVSISKTLTDILTLGSDDFLILSSTSKTPYTGVITDLSSYFRGIEGVGLVSPEVLTPVVVGGRVVFLRGVNITLFKDLGVVKYLSGSWPESQYDVLVGSRLSNYLGVNVGDSILITGIPTGKEVRVFVRGTYVSNTPLDDELLSTSSLAKELRGIQGNYVTLVRVRFVGYVNKSLIPNYLSPTKDSSIPSTVLKSLKVVEGGSELLDEVLGRGVKMSSNFLWSSTLLVITSSVLAIYYGISWVLNNLNDVLTTLRFLGLSRFRVALLVITKLLILSITSGILGYLTSYSILKLVFDLLKPQILAHTIELVIDSKVLLLTTLVPSIITVASVMVRVREL